MEKSLMSALFLKNFLYEKKFIDLKGKNVLTD